MRVLQTTYGGIRFRSRTEAIWAVFFDVAGIAWDYEPEGFLIREGAYLPDFWLRDLRMFFEVKGLEPTETEVAKCAQLSEAAECDVLLAVGNPDERFQIMWFDRAGKRDGLYVFARDVAADGGFWLIEETGDATGCWVGPPKGALIPKGPMFSGALEEAYATARAARFDGLERRRRYQPAQHVEPWTEERAA